MPKLTIAALLTELLLKLLELADSVGDPEVGDDGRGVRFVEAAGYPAVMATRLYVARLRAELRGNGVALSDIGYADRFATIGDWVTEVTELLDALYEGQPQAV